MVRQVYECMFFAFPAYHICWDITCRRYFSCRFRVFNTPAMDPKIFDVIDRGSPYQKLLGEGRALKAHCISWVGSCKVKEHFKQNKQTLQNNNRLRSVFIVIKRIVLIIHINI